MPGSRFCATGAAHAHAAKRLKLAYPTPTLMHPWLGQDGSQIERNIANDGQYHLLYNAKIVPTGGNRVVEVKKNNATMANSFQT